MPTLEQRKAVFRTIFDIAIHNKRELSDNHEYCLMKWGQSNLHLSIIEMQECLSPAMSNGFANFQQLSNLSKDYQIEFRKLLYRMLNYNQSPTLQEKQDFDSVLSVIENRYGLPNTYMSFSFSTYNDEKPLLSWY